ncbi:MAG: hypothetical protein HC866_24210 [Leptolyngbyaceae cyanobacterium RU_5_1]|nr:hypothetical protein [Leptolyngbyaceae cyanobacterium RU_5_1]
MALANSSNKRPKASVVKQNMIGHALALLQELPEKPKENMSLREAVEQMQDSIRAALAKGYSYDDLAKMLTDKGIKISALTLKNYAPSGKRQAAKAAAKTAEKTKAKRTRKSVDNEFVDIEESELAVESPVRGTTSAAKETVESAPAKPRRGRAKSAEASAATTESTAAKPKRGRAKSAATEATVETEISTRPTRGRKSSTTRLATQSAVGRRRRSSAE